MHHSSKPTNGTSKQCESLKLKDAAHARFPANVVVLDTYGNVIQPHKEQEYLVLYGCVTSVCHIMLIALNQSADLNRIT
jgi:hypothetical protein